MIYDKIRDEKTIKKTIKNAQAFSVSHKCKCSSVKSVSGLGCAKQDKVFQNNISFGITFKEQGLCIYLWPVKFTYPVFDIIIAQKIYLY